MQCDGYSTNAAVPGCPVSKLASKACSSKQLMQVLTAAVRRTCRQSGSRICKLSGFENEEQLYATVSLLPYANLEELDASSLRLVRGEPQASSGQHRHLLAAVAGMEVKNAATSMQSKCHVLAHLLVEMPGFPELATPIVVT